MRLQENINIDSILMKTVLLSLEEEKEGIESASSKNETLDYQQPQRGESKT